MICFGIVSYRIVSGKNAIQLPPFLVYVVVYIMIYAFIKTKKYEFNIDFKSDAN